MRLELDQVGGAQVMRHQYRLDIVTRRRRLVSGLSEQLLEQAFGYLGHIGLPLAQIGIFKLVELRNQSFGLRLERPLGIAIFIGDHLARRDAQQRIVQNHLVQFEEGIELGGGMGRTIAAQAGEFIARGQQCGIEARDLFIQG